MKTNENACERTLWMFLGVLALLTLGVWMLGGCESEAPGKTMSAADCIRAEKQHEAEIRAEANAPGMSAQDEKRIASVMAAHAARDQHELAEYAKFQFEQRLELAEASAPRVFVSPEGETGEGTANQTSVGGHRQSLALAGHSSHQRRGGAAIDGGISSDRFYARSIEEDSVNQMVSDSADREKESEGNTNAGNGAPFGNPVPGRAGYVTSPPSQGTSGYIDVRGYEPGSTVIDPYTGQKIRVP
jgi:hypothetical protein